MKDNDLTKLEFLLTLNNHIVVQRFFNVKNYNPKAKNSLQMYEYLKEISDSLHYDLKMKTLVYMMDNQYLIEENPEVLNTSLTDASEYFNIYIKEGDDILAHRVLDAKLYPPKVRYTVDLRPILKSILKDISDILTSKKLSFEYLGYSLID